MSTNKYPNSGSLEHVRNVLTQAGDAVNNPFKNSNISIIPELVETLAVPGGAVAGGAIGVGAVAASGTVGLGATGITTGLAALGSMIGGGMVAGLFVFSAPAVVCGVGAYVGVQYWKSHRLNREKQALLDEARLKKDAIIDLLNNKNKLPDDQILPLQHLNIKLQQIIDGLKWDLGV